MSAFKKKSVRAAKISHIWCLARDLGFDSDLLHVVVESVTGSASISALDAVQLWEVATHLQALVKKQKIERYRQNRRNRAAGVSFLPTPDQRDLVDRLMKAITPRLNLHNPSAYLQSICRKTFRKDYGKLDRYQVQNLIEALKSILDRSQRTAG